MNIRLLRIVKVIQCRPKRPQRPDKPTISRMIFWSHSGDFIPQASFPSLAIRGLLVKKIRVDKGAVAFSHGLDLVKIYRIGESGPLFAPFEDRGHSRGRH